MTSLPSGSLAPVPTRARMLRQHAAFLQAAGRDGRSQPTAEDVLRFIRSVYPDLVSTRDVARAGRCDIRRAQRIISELLGARQLREMRGRWQALPPRAGDG